MYTIPHYFNLKEFIPVFNDFEREMKNYSNPTIQPSISNYTNLLDNLASTIRKVTKKLFLKHVKHIDDSFKN